MKKIINKIKQNENLCKVLKVLKLVLDLVVYGFAIFMLIGLAIGSTYKPKESNAQERQLIPNVATTPIRKGMAPIIENGDEIGYYFGSGDMSADIFYNSVVSEWGTQWSYNKSDTFDWEFTQAQYFYNTQVIYVNHNSVGDLNNYTHYDVNKIRITKEYSTNTAEYNVYIYYNTTYYLRFNYKYWINNWYDNNVNIPGHVVCETLISWYPGASSTNTMPKDVFIKIFNNKTSLLYNLFVKYADNDGARAMGNGLATGYNIGYQDGKSVGYDEGYSAGSTGMTTNPFNLLSNAFSGIATLLDIQIIPGLTLGVLVFTPLIVGIIIVVVKLVKG